MARRRRRSAVECRDTRHLERLATVLGYASVEALRAFAASYEAAKQQGNNEPAAVTSDVKGTRTA